jgi:glycosyltransferase involved in cell wall biosynthesis
MPLIPDKINLLPEMKKYSVLEASMGQCFRSGYIDVALARCVYKIVRKCYMLLHPAVRDDDDFFRSCITTWLMPRINPVTDYDLAISFLTPHKIVLDKVRAKKKVAWIHTDYSSLPIDKKLPLLIWGKYDYIVSISCDITKSFSSVFPSLADRLVEIENILSPEFIWEQAGVIDVEQEMPSFGIKLLSIGRYCHPKNFDNVPDIARRVMEHGNIDFRWYIIGFGPDEDLIRQKIAEAGMEEHVILLGKKENPYPYIKACDIYVQPSRYEGKSVTVREAQVLCKPVIITDYTTSGSQVQNGIDGVIVPMDNEGCARGIIDAIKNPDMLNSISSYLSTHDYGNEKEVEKVYQLLY